MSASPYTLLLSLYSSIPFGNPEPADDDLFPPIRPPADETASASQTNDSGQGGEDVDVDADPDAEAEAVTEDGSEAAEESDEASSPLSCICVLF
jgi:hypothetical protein